MSDASDSVVTSFKALSDSEKLPAQKGIQAVAGLTEPSRNFLGAVWIILMVTLATVVLGGGWLVYLLVIRGKTSDVIVGGVSAALGALIGLLAPSPATGAQK